MEPGEQLRPQQPLEEVAQQEYSGMKCGYCHGVIRNPMEQAVCPTDGLVTHVDECMDSNGGKCLSIGCEEKLVPVMKKKAKFSKRVNERLKGDYTIEEDSDDSIEYGREELIELGEELERISRILYRLSQKIEDDGDGYLRIYGSQNPDGSFGNSYQIFSRYEPEFKSTCVNIWILGENGLEIEGDKYNSLQIHPVMEKVPWKKWAPVSVNRPTDEVAVTFCSRNGHKKKHKSLGEVIDSIKNEKTTNSKNIEILKSLKKLNFMVAKKYLS